MTRDSPLFRLFNEIGIVAQLSGNLFERAMPEGMTLAQFTVLNHFVRLGGERSPAALADAFQVTRATMSSTLQRLEGKGLVALRPDDADGRAKKVAITPAGAEMRERCVAALAPALRDLEAAIGPARIETLLPKVEALRKTLDSRRSAVPGTDG
jgi:DNA-binding MarR family transcriptional regulator